MNNPTLYYASCVTDENIFNAAAFELTDPAIENVWNVDGITEFRPRLQSGEGNLIEQLLTANVHLSQVVAAAMGITIEEVFDLVDKKANSLLPDLSV